MQKTEITFVRKLQKVADNNFIISVPADIVRTMGWDKGQNIIFTIDEDGKKVHIKGRR